jgi:hypothetical protein
MEIILLLIIIFLLISRKKEDNERIVIRCKKPTYKAPPHPGKNKRKNKV